MMEDTDKVLKSCLIHAGKTARKMNVFSILSAVSIAMMALSGIGLVVLASKLRFPAYHLDLILGGAGVGLIVVAAFLVPALKLLRNTCHAADQTRVNREYEAVSDLLFENYNLWRYMTFFMAVLFVLGMVAVLFSVLVVMTIYSTF